QKRDHALNQILDRDETDLVGNLFGRAGLERRSAELPTFEDGRLDEARTKRGDPNAVERGFDTQCERHADDRVLARRVGDGAGKGDETGDRGRVHDVPEALLFHDGERGVNAVHHTTNVHVERVIPILERML